MIQDVNNNHSGPEVYYPRWLTPGLQQASQDHPVVVVTGARQVGKSTLLTNAEPFRSWRFHTLDDLATLRQAREGAAELWAGTSRVVLDEVQKAPELLLAIKQEVDRHPGRSRFVLSGSANLLLMRQVSESLAGRAVYFVLRPMTIGEMRQVSPPNILARALAADWPEEQTLADPPPDPLDVLLRGLMPPLLTLHSPSAWTRWWDGYVTTYLERDLRQLSQVEALPDFRRVMAALALRTGQLVNQTSIARDTGVSQPTVHRYLNLLETSCLLYRVSAIAPSRTKRIVKSPKIYWFDPGIATFLAGHFTTDDLRSSREAGGLFECLVLLHLNAMAQLMTPRPGIFYWRTTTGREVDFVVEQGRRILPIEVKLTEKPRYRDVQNLRVFMDEYKEATLGVLVHCGSDVMLLDRDIIAMPWTLLTGVQS
jgi:hypothetical protein